MTQKFPRKPYDVFILFFDIGVRNALNGIVGNPLSQNQKGRLFEHWFILQCLAYNRAFKKDWKLSSYRTNAGAEVDLIIDTGPKFLAIECKYKKYVTKADLKGLRSFETISHKPTEKIVVFRGETKQKFSKKDITQF